MNNLPDACSTDVEQLAVILAQMPTSDYFDALQKARESWSKFEGVVGGGTLIRLRL